MFVKCIIGFPGILEEGQIYEVERVTISGHFLLTEISPPLPHTCFDKKRFESINIDDINIEEIFEFTMEL